MQEGALHRLEVLHTIADHLNRMVDLRTMLEEALPLVLQFLNLQTGWISLLDEEGRFPWLPPTASLPP